MPTGPRRDQAALRRGVAAWVRAESDLVPGIAPDGKGTALEVTRVTHADAGMANETVLVDVTPGHGGIVLRLPPLQPTFPDADLLQQAVVQNALAAVGIPAPAPAVFVPDPQWIGTPFLAMPRVNGFIPGPAPVFDPAITGAPLARQRKLHDGLVDVLADLHAVDWRTHGLAHALPGPTVDAALEQWGDYVAWAGEGDALPVLTESLDWCARHRPADRGSDAALLWGDARLGNVVFDDDGDVHAVLDWDLAALGPPEMDLGWYFGLDFMMEQLFDRRVPGFPDRDEAVARYEKRSGHRVADLDWHEVFALIRALAINDRHQRMAVAQRAGLGDEGITDRRRENPMIGVLSSRIEALG